MTVRVRFAPSPTGPLHIGGVRTALFNYLFARNRGGVFILRIEDTDQFRAVPGAEEYIIESLQWCGIEIDEGGIKGGPHQPYRQSERKDIYRKYAEILVNSGKAYYAFDTPEELEELRNRIVSGRSGSFQYDALTRNRMKNSLTLSESEVKTRIEKGDPYVIRFMIPSNEEIRVYDQIRDWVVVNTSTLDDKVLFKSDGMPTYHLANVTDDYLMKITHVIRGEEWLPSLPLHVLLYKAFGWEHVMPAFAHLPLILKPDGKGKLSKRDGDRLGFPVFPLQWKDSFSGEISSGYREAGYFPEAFVNILAFLGWNPGGEKEVFTLGELIAAFSLERVGKSGSKFDPEKARWYNHQFLIQKNDTQIAGLFLPVLKEKGIEADLSFVTKVCKLVKERVNFVHELWDQAYYFFRAPETYDPQVIQKRWKETTPGMMNSLNQRLSEADDFTVSGLDRLLHDFIESGHFNTGEVMNGLRLLMVGTSMGPHLPEILALLGKEEVNRRIGEGIRRITHT